MKQCRKCIQNFWGSYHFGSFFQHSLSQNPVFIFDYRRGLFPPYGGPDGKKLTRKLIYSRFRPVKSFRSEGDDNDGLTMAAFSKDQQFLYAGTVLGDVKVWVYNLNDEK